MAGVGGVGDEDGDEVFGYCHGFGVGGGHWGVCVLWSGDEGVGEIRCMGEAVSCLLFRLHRTLGCRHWRCGDP